MRSIFKKSLSFIMVFCLTFFSLVAVVKVKAESETVKYNVTAKDAVTIDTTLNAAPSGSTATYSNTYANSGKTGQLTESNSSTLTLTGYAGTTIKSITLSMKSNTKKGSGSLSIKIGSTEVDSIATGAFNKNWYSSYSTSYVDIKRDINASVGEGESITIVIAATVSSLYCNGYTIEYEGGASSSIVLSADKSDVKVNDNVQLTTTAKNFETAPTSFTYNSSDTSVATVDANGKVTFVGMGNVSVTATADSVTSNAVEFTVYPDNTNPVTVATAIEVAKLAGTSNSAFEYTVVGTVANSEYSETYKTTTFDLTDETGSIKVFGNAKSVQDGEKVQVCGKLVNYSSTTPEFVSSAVCKGYYTVTFTNDSTTHYTLTDVLEGSKIAAPTAPEKTNHTLVGWLNGETLWDFDNDVVTGNLTLVAKWQNNALNAFVENVNAVQAYMSLAYKYTVTVTTSTSTGNDVITVSDTSASSTGYVDSTITKTNATYLATNAKNDSAIQLRSKNSNSGIVMSVNNTNCGIASITVKWATSSSKATNDGKILDFYGSNTAYTAPTNLYDSSKKGTKLGSMTFNSANLEQTFEVESDFLYIGLRSNSGALYLESVTVTFTSGASVSTYSDVDFRLKLGVDASIASIEGLPDGENYTYGIEVSTSSKTKDYTTLHTDGTVQYVVVSLSDVLNNPERLTTVFTVRAYAEYNGERYYSSKVQEHSVASIVKAYQSSDTLTDEQKAVINDLYAILTALKCYAE